MTHPTKHLQAACENHPPLPALFKISLREEYASKPQNLCGDCTLQFIHDHRPRSLEERQPSSSGHDAGSNPAGDAKVASLGASVPGEDSVSTDAESSRPRGLLTSNLRDVVSEARSLCNELTGEDDETRGSIDIVTILVDAMRGLQKDHVQYVEWATPQLERLGREMAENGRLRAALEQYGSHTERCDKRHESKPCSCGWEAASSAPEQATPNASPVSELGSNNEAQPATSDDEAVQTTALAEANRRWPKRGEDPEKSRAFSAFMAGVRFVLAQPPAPETSEPPEPTPEMIHQGVWVWSRNDRFSMVEDVRAIYIAMRRIEMRSYALETKTNHLWLGPGVTYPCDCRSSGPRYEPPWYSVQHNRSAQETTACLCSSPTLECPIHAPASQKAPTKRMWRFDRYRDGKLMAQGIMVRATNYAEAYSQAVSLLYIDGNKPTDELRLVENGKGNGP